MAVGAATLWSLSGAFAKTLGLEGPVMAAWRAMFAGLFLATLIRPGMVRWTKGMGLLLGCFAGMNLTFIWAMTLTSAANVIFLQYTAPALMIAGSVVFLGERLDRASLAAVALALVGVVVIVAGSPVASAWGLGLALAAGVLYAGVALMLRALRDEDALWLTVVNHLGTGVVLLPVAFLLCGDRALPGWGALAGLAVFGVIQMGTPYVLFARSLKGMSAQEAGVICLLEALLNPIVTWVVVGEVPAPLTVLGGIFILGGVVLRYARPSKGETR
jgi:drug/metabolite transporter (DMT)-like permease